VAMSKYGLTLGNPELASAGAIVFGPEGILFVADSTAATVFAIDVADETRTESTVPVEVSGLDTKLAVFLGVNRADVLVRGMAVHPMSQAVYLSVTRGRGNAAQPVLVRVSADGDISDVPLTDVAFAQVSIGDAPADADGREDVSLDRSSEDAVDREYNGIRFSMAKIKLRASTITDLAWIDGTLLVAGASNEEFSSTLRRIPFPFTGGAESNSLEIYHVSHGKYETASPIRTFVPFDGNTSILASYTCTPVVQFSFTDLQPGALVKGRTVAELGPINQPLDMISYTHAGDEYLLVSNTRHPLLKIATAPIAGQPALHEPTEPVGVPREELDHEGVSYLANLGASHVVMLQRDSAGALNLRSYTTASL
jgi:hypothetical protein